MKTAKAFLKITKCVLVAFMLVILASNIYVMIISSKKTGTHPSVFGFSTAVVVSGSMEPAVGIDDLIVIKSQRSYEVGDVITFSSSGKLPVTHRIVAINEDGSFQTKGDANNGADVQPVYPADITGKVILVLANGGYVISFLRTPIGLLLITLIMFSVLLIPDKSSEA